MRRGRQVGQRTLQHWGLVVSWSFSSGQVEVQPWSPWSFYSVWMWVSYNDTAHSILSILSGQQRLLATSHGFCQKTKFQPGAALLINIIIDCNYLTSPSIPRGTHRETCFAKWSFYLCKTEWFCSGVLLACVKPLESCAGTRFNELREFRGWCLKVRVLSLTTVRVFSFVCS